MSRDMSLPMSRDLCLVSESSGQAARSSLRVAPVGPGGVDGVGGEDFSGFEFDDGDIGVVGDGEDSFARSPITASRLFAPLVLASLIVRYPAFGTQPHTRIRFLSA